MATTNTGNGKSNAQAALDAWFAKCEELGETKGAGAAAELNWWEDMVERANNGDIGLANVENGFLKWRAAADKRAGAARAKPLGKGTKAKALSEARALIQWGGLPNAKAPKVFGLVRSVVEQTVDLRGELAEHLLKIARYQIKQQPDSPLTRDEIKQKLLEDPIKPEPVLVEELAKVRAKLNKIIEKFGGKANIRAAINSLSAEIEAQGGTAAERKAAAKAARAASKINKKKR